MTAIIKHIILNQLKTEVKEKKSKVKRKKETLLSKKQE